MKFASVAVALASSVSTSAAGSTIGSDVAKKASFYFAMAPERDCAAVQHNVTACFEEKHGEDLQPCLDDAYMTRDRCGGYRSCVEKHLVHNHECHKDEEEILECWGCGECHAEKLAAFHCLNDGEQWRECSAKISWSDGPEMCSLLEACDYPYQCTDKVSEYKHCIKCPEPEQPTPERPPVCEKEQEATDCIVWHAPGAMECLQGEEISLCDRINGCEKFGRCESKVKMAAKECWGCTDEGQTLPTQQFLKNVGRVLKKNIRG